MAHLGYPARRSIELGNHLAFEQAAYVARTRESMARLTPRFSINRAVCEYTEQHYLPAASTYRERSGNKGAIGSVEREHTLERK